MILEMLEKHILYFITFVPNIYLYIGMGLNFNFKNRSDLYGHEEVKQN